MPRSIWKGSISFGLVDMPVGLYPGEERKELSLSMLDGRDPEDFRAANAEATQTVEIVAFVDGGDLKELGVSDKELEMAERLVDGMLERWRPEKYRDEYRDDLLGLVRETERRHGERRAA